MVKLKIVIRKIPPSVAESTIQTKIGEKWMEEATFWKFTKGPKSPLPWLVHPSRAYIAFRDESTVWEFYDHFMNKVTIPDPRKGGRESKLIVEFAGYQRIVPIDAEKGKVDRRVGTIQDDKDYQAWLVELEKHHEATAAAIEGAMQNTAMMSIRDQTETVVEEKPRVTTPIVQDLHSKIRAGKLKRRRRARGGERRRRGRRPPQDRRISSRSSKRK